MINLSPESYEMLKLFNSGSDIPDESSLNQDCLTQLFEYEFIETHIIDYDLSCCPAQAIFSDYKITEKGKGYIVAREKEEKYRSSIDEIANSIRQQGSSANFNFSGATFTNSAVGNEVSGNTFTYNAGASLAELESLIQSKPSEDQAILNEMLEVLREIQSSEKPVDKGRLSHFYEVVKKSSDLLLPLGQFFVDIFFRI